jgi:transcriptional regulator with XRE-family HTH domain
MKTWSSVRSELFSPDEIRESDLRVDIIGEIIKARQDKHISQRELETMSGVRQPIISRMEAGETSPQLETVLRLLAPLGKTLAIVPIDSIGSVPKSRLMQAFEDIDNNTNLSVPFTDAADAVRDMLSD